MASGLISLLYYLLQKVYGRSQPISTVYGAPQSDFPLLPLLLSIALYVVH